MISSITVVSLLVAAFCVFLFSLMLDIKSRHTPTPIYQMHNCQHFIGTWKYFDHKRERFYYFTITNDYQITLNGQPIDVTIVLVSPTVFIFKDPYGFNMKLHYYSPDSFSLYDEANECYYTLTRLSKEKNVNEIIR